MEIGKILEEKARQFPQKTAVIFRDKEIDFACLRDSVFKLAASLKNLGIKKGDKVAIYLPNWPEYIYSYLAIWVLGATAVPLDFMLTEDELVSCVSHSDAVALIGKQKAAISLPNIKNNCPRIKNIILCHEKIEGCLSFEELLEKESPAIPQKVSDDNDDAIIFYTSGTTGRPKGVLINYRQLGAPPKAMEYFVDLSAKDMVLCAVPFSHIGGLIYIQDMLYFGLTMVLLERFIPLEFLKAVQNYKINCFWIVPSMYYALLQLKEFEKFDLSSLRWIVTFGASSSPDALRRFNQYCPNARLLNGWGLTETNAPTTVIALGSKKIESVGRPLPWVEVKVFSDNGKELPNGETGEIVVRGWVVSGGYYKDEKLTRETIRNGWFYTGDLGRFDADGDLYISGRIKEMIKVGGEIVFEPEVESVIHRHPDIAEVAVIGINDRLRGEVPKAFVVFKEGRDIPEDELRQFCRQHLAHFKIPHYFEFRESLPKNRTGKIDKEALRR